MDQEIQKIWAAINKLELELTNRLVDLENKRMYCQGLNLYYNNVLVEFRDRLTAMEQHWVDYTGLEL